MIILLFNLGFTKHQLNKKEDAELFYKKSIKIKKNLSLNNLSSIYWENNQKTKSINCLKESLEINESEITLANLCNFLLQNENYCEALNYSTRAINLKKSLNSR